MSIVHVDFSNKLPNMKRVEILLGGVCQVMYEDGTQQFVSESNGEVFLYSPRMLPEELERFCEENLDKYKSINEVFKAEIAEMEDFKIEPFWEK